MTTIAIAYEVSAEKIAKVEQHLESVAARDLDWNGAEFKIVRDDFTYIAGGDDSAEANALLNDIQNIIAGCVC